MPYPGPEGPVQARLRRPLHRTHSAPLPLAPHLMGTHIMGTAPPSMGGAPPNMSGQQTAAQDSSISQKMYLKQRIQSAVLQRAGSKNQMENVDEEVEVKVGVFVLFCTLYSYRHLLAKLKYLFVN